MQVLSSGPSYRLERAKTRIRSPFFFLILLVIPVVLYWLGRSFEHGITEALIPLFPLEKDKGFVFYLDFVRLCMNELLWLSFFCLIAWWLVAVPSRLKKRFFLHSVTNVQAILLTCIFFCVTTAISWFTLETFPNSSDEFAYLVQAKTLSEGKFSDPVPVYSDAFHYNHIAVKDGVRVGRFPPGWPILLGSAYVTGIEPWLINPIIGSVSLLLFYLFASRYYGAHIALLSFLIVALSSYFIFNTASYFSHVSCFLTILAFVWMFKLFEEKRHLGFLLAAGFCIGVVSVIRYYTAVLVVLPFIMYVIYHCRLKSVSVLAMLLVGALPSAVFLLWYNYSLTGNAFTPVTVWAYTDEQLGFVKGHTVFKGFEHIVRRVFMFMYWCSPGVLILYFVFLWKKIRSVGRWSAPEDYLFIMLLLGHFVYYQIGGNQYGPRFLLEAFPFVALFIARSFLTTRFTPGYAALLVAGFIFAITKFPMIVAREAAIVDERQDLYDLVEKKGVQNAVVVVESSTSPVRPMPIGDLTRNSADFNSSILYIQNVPETQAVLQRYQSSRALYRYVRNSNEVHGHLIPLHELQSDREQ